MTGISTMRSTMRSQIGGVPSATKTTSEITMTVSRNAVPQRGCAFGYSRMCAGVSVASVLVRVDRAVLGAVVLEHAADVAHAADQPDVSDQHHQPQHPLGDHLGVVVADDVAEPAREQHRAGEEDAATSASMNASIDASCEPAHLLLGLPDRHLRRPGERAHAECQRLVEHDDAAHDGDPARPAACRRRSAPRRAVTIAPLGARTATAMWRGPRIMTPSMTACPP